MTCTSDNVILVANIEVHCGRIARRIMRAAGGRADGRASWLVEQPFGRRLGPKWLPAACAWAVIIFLGNIGVLLAGLPLLTARVTVLTSMGWWLQESGAILQRLSRWW